MRQTALRNRPDIVALMRHPGRGMKKSTGTFSGQGCPGHRADVSPASGSVSPADCTPPGGQFACELDSERLLRRAAAGRPIKASFPDGTSMRAPVWRREGAEKVAPFPWCSLGPHRPPWRSTIRCAVARPMPWPSTVSTGRRWKGTTPAWAMSKPGPLSRTKQAGSPATSITPTFDDGFSLSRGTLPHCRGGSSAPPARDRCQRRPLSHRQSGT